MPVRPTDLRRMLAVPTLVGALALGGIVGSAALPGAAMAQSSIRVLVNDEPITSYDIQQRSRMLQVFSRGKQGEKQAIDQLIDEHLMMQEASRRNMSVSDAEVDAELSGRASQVKLSVAQFSAAMRQAGFDPKTFRDFIRANMAWSQIVRARFRATVTVSDQDVAQALTNAPPAEGEAAATAYEYRLQQILFIVAQNGGAAAEAGARRKAEAFRTAFQSCDQAVAQAGGAPGVVVRPQVRREEGAMSAELKKSVASLAVGGVTGPERVPEGIQIVAVCAKTPIAGQTETTVETREKLQNDRGQLLARRYLRDLRSDAVIEYR